MKVSDLTPGERIVVSRRRRGLSQREHAAAMGVTLYRYRAWELDEVDDSPAIRLGRLLPHEACFVLRRRAGIALQDMAHRLGVSRFWLAKMESGRAPVDHLQRFWQRKIAKAS